MRSHQLTLEQLRAVILLVLNALAHKEESAERKTAFIIVDRLDSADDVHIDVVMNELTRIVSYSECRVKVAVVVETSQMEGSWRVQAVPTQWCSPDRLLDLHMDQHQIEWRGRMVEIRPKIWSGIDSAGRLDTL